MQELNLSPRCSATQACYLRYVYQTISIHDSPTFYFTEPIYRFKTKFMSAVFFIFIFPCPFFLSQKKRLQNARIKLCIKGRTSEFLMGLCVVDWETALLTYPFPLTHQKNIVIAVYIYCSHLHASCVTNMFVSMVLPQLL